MNTVIDINQYRLDKQIQRMAENKKLIRDLKKHEKPIDLLGSFFLPELFAPTDGDNAA